MACQEIDRRRLAAIYQRLGRGPIPPGDPDCAPLTVEEKVALERLQRRLTLEPPGQVCQLMGARGDGRSSALLAVQAGLAEAGWVTAYVDAERYLHPVGPVTIAGLLMMLAGGVGDALSARFPDHAAQMREKLDGWRRCRTWLAQHDRKTAATGETFQTDIRENLREAPEFQALLQSTLDNYVGWLKRRVDEFFGEAIDVLQAWEGRPVKIACLVDSLDRLSGFSMRKQKAAEELAETFAAYESMLALPNAQVVYTTPVWFKLLGVKAERGVTLPSRFDQEKTQSLRAMAERRLCGRNKQNQDKGIEEPLAFFFGETRRLDELITAAGGRRRATLRALQTMILTAESFPVSDQALRQTIGLIRQEQGWLYGETARLLSGILAGGQPELKTPAEAMQLAQLLDEGHVDWDMAENRWRIHPLIEAEIKRFAI